MLGESHDLNPSQLGAHLIVWPVTVYQDECELPVPGGMQGRACSSLPQAGHWRRQGLKSLFKRGPTPAELRGSQHRAWGKQDQSFLPGGRQRQWTTSRLLLSPLRRNICESRHHPLLWPLSSLSCGSPLGPIPFSMRPGAAKTGGVLGFYQ